MFVRLTITIFIIFAGLQPVAQDLYTGTWESLPATVKSPHCKIEVSQGEKGILFPAKLTITHKGFQGVYHFLLVKKNARQIAIGRNKYAVSETPFSLGNRLLSLNGWFELIRDYRENTQQIAISRFPVASFGFTLNKETELPEAYRSLGAEIFGWLASGDVCLKKINGQAWESADIQTILDPTQSPVSYGIEDSIIVKRKDGYLHFPRTRKMDNDSLTISLNGKIILDQIALNKKNEPEVIILDTGMNILVAFADNYGKNPPNQGRAEIDFLYKKWMVDFNKPEHLGASFIVHRLVYEIDKANSTTFDQYLDSSFTGKVLDRSTKWLGGIVATSRQVTLALWDDALEDADSISLNINGQWIVRGFPVLKKPQFLQVTLNPGPNSIIFVADNLGGVPPNTSVLEIIDGKKRKSFMIDTDMEKNNLVRIFYEVQSGD